MEAVAHSPSFAKKAGVPQSVGKDFSAADKGRKFGKGGGMKKYAEGGMSEKDKTETAAYRKKPEYYGYEDYSPSGRAALRHYNQEAEKTDIKDYVKRKDGPPYNPTVAKKAQAVQREVMNEGRRETRGTVPAEALKKGGEVKESKAMVGKELAFMKKKGAPASMIKHEKAEMKAGGKVRRMAAGGAAAYLDSLENEDYEKQRAAGAKNYESLKSGLGSMADFFMGRRSKDKASAPIERRDIDRTNEMSTSANTGYTPPLGITKPNIQSPRTRQENESTSYSDSIERDDAAAMDKTVKGPQYTSSTNAGEGEYSGPSFKQEPRATRSSEPVRTRKPIGVEKTQTKERVITAPVKPAAKEAAKFSSDSPDLESRMEAMKPKRKFGMASDETRAAIRKGLGSAFDFFDLSKAHEREFGKKMAKGGNVKADGVAKKGKTEGKMVKMAAGGFVKTADGCAQRGKTKAFQVKMKRGGMC
jgi:hypothetical protein